MFDIGFWELAMIGVVALVVIGPERLPAVARGVGRWFGKIRYFMASVKADIDKEIRADELRRILDEQAKKSGLHEIIEQTSDIANEAERAVRESQVALTRQAQQDALGGHGAPSPAAPTPAEDTPQTPEQKPS